MESKYRRQILADGVLVQRLWTETSGSAASRSPCKRYSTSIATSTTSLDPESQTYFEKTLAFMNDEGATPLIVLTPINPKLLKVVDPLGWYTRHGQVVDYVESLKATYDFEFVDITDMTKFGADPVQFYDGVHMTTINTRRAIDYVLKRPAGSRRSRRRAGSRTGGMLLNSYTFVLIFLPSWSSCTGWSRRATRGCCI